MQSDQTEVSKQYLMWLPFKPASILTPAHFVQLHKVKDFQFQVYDKPIIPSRCNDEIVYDG